MVWLTFHVFNPRLRYDMSSGRKPGWSIQYDIKHQGSETLSMRNKPDDLLRLPSSLFIRAMHGGSSVPRELGRMHYVPAQKASDSVSARRSDGLERLSAELTVPSHDLRNLVEAEQHGHSPCAIVLHLRGVRQSFIGTGIPLEWNLDTTYLTIENGFFSFTRENCSRSYYWTAKSDYLQEIVRSGQRKFREYKSVFYGRRMVAMLVALIMLLLLFR